LFRDFFPDEIVEIGSGASEKTRRIRDAVSAGGRTVRYVPLDVDRQTIESSAARLIRDYPALSVHAVVGDFERDLPHVRPPSGRRLALFLGSTIGNLDEPARRRLLAGVRGLLPDHRDRLLLGVDLVKDVKILEAAYDDSAGVTRDFNRNILHVINRDVDGNFHPEAFRHRAFYNAAAARIEMHLVADSAQHVKPGGAGSPAALLARDLLAAVAREAGRVRLLTLGEQVERVVAQGAHAPFATAIGIGSAGRRVAETLHERAGWFPRIRRVGLTREED